MSNTEHPGFEMDESWETGQPNGVGVVEPSDYREWYCDERISARRLVITYTGPWEPWSYEQEFPERAGAERLRRERAKAAKGISVIELAADLKTMGGGKWENIAERLIAKGWKK